MHCDRRRKSLWSSFPDHLTELDLDGNILNTNRVEDGQTLEQAIGTNVYDHLSPDHRDRLGQAIESAKR
ncbi:MAG: hypothetical protein O6952_06065, partial [Planctomycetota bacterium]|nr:hypothetical protein [Planctomycetota bacterium]